jgi:hypothetical protein
VNYEGLPLLRLVEGKAAIDVVVVVDRLVGVERAVDRAYRSWTAIAAAQSTTSVLARNTVLRSVALAIRPSPGLATASATSRNAV